MLSQKDQAIEYALSDEENIKRFKSLLLPQPNGCVEFAGAKWDSRDMYRAFPVKIITEDGTVFRNVKAHRLSFALANGFDALPKSSKLTNGKSDTKIINHICHNKKCVEPTHLNVLTNRENTNSDNRKPV
jgi:hypothetical protein